MSATEHQILMWMVYWAGAAGALCSLVMATHARTTAGDGSVAFAVGVGGGALGGSSAALLGLILGFIVKPYDVPGEPGFFQAIWMGLGGFVMGGVIGLGTGLIVGGLVAAGSK